MSQYKQIRDFRDSKKMNSVSLGAQSFFVRSFMEADDYGVLRGAPMLLRSLLWPDEEYIQYETDGPKVLLNANLVLGWIKECVSVNLVTAYTVDHKPYIQIVNFNQKGLTHPKGKYPLPTSSLSFPTFPDLSRSAPEVEVDIEVDTEKEVEHDKKKQALGVFITSVVDYLNETCGTEYRASTKKTRELITARLREKFTFEDFKKVIVYKHQDWGNRPDMQKFLRPETLFGNKFEGYLQAAGMIVTPKSKMDEINASAQELLNTIRNGGK